MNEFLYRHDKNIILNFKNVDKVFPNVCVPIAGMIETLTSVGFQFEFYYPNTYLKNTCFLKPCLISSNTTNIKGNCLDKIWRFDNYDDILVIYEAFVSAITENIECEKGVIDAFIWCIHETLENVIRHSGKDYGYVMGQVHRQAKNFVFCIYDTGQGIYKSLQPSEYNPQNPEEALKLCVKEGVTRDKTIGKGNGLWGLHQIVTENTGQLSITSNSARYKLVDSRISTFSKIPELSFDGGSIIDFSIRTDKEISFSKALNGYEPTNYQREAREDDTTGSIVYDIKDTPLGTGTRHSGAKVRTAVINDFKATNKVIVLDFTGVPMISSSFADELVGKLVVELGFMDFTNNIKIVGLTPNAQIVTERTVAQRMAETLHKEK